MSHAPQTGAYLRIPLQRCCQFYHYKRFINRFREYYYPPFDCETSPIFFLVENPINRPTKRKRYRDLTNQIKLQPLQKLRRQWMVIMSRAKRCRSINIFSFFHNICTVIVLIFLWKTYIFTFWTYCIITDAVKRDRSFPSQSFSVIALR